MLASNLDAPNGIVAVAETLYVAEGGPGPNGTIVALSPGGNPTTIASAQQSPTDIVSDGMALYWTNGEFMGPGALVRFPLSPIVGPAQTLAAGGDPTQVAIWQDNIFWVDTNKIDEVSRQGGSQVQLAAVQGLIDGLAVDQKNIYWSSSLMHAVSIQPVAGGSSTVLASDSKMTPGAIAVDATNVYFVDSASGADDGAIVQVLLTGGTATVLAPGQRQPRAIAIDDSGVYWITEGHGLDGTVAKVAKSGGPITVLASNQSSPFGIALDADCVYWTTGDGAVFAVAK